MAVLNDVVVMDVEDIVEGERARRQMGDIKGLAADIHENSLLHPLGVQKGTNRLIWGGRRLAALRYNGASQCLVRVLTIEKYRLHDIENSENKFNKPLLPSEIVALGDFIEADYKAAKKTRAGTSTAGTPSVAVAANGVGAKTTHYRHLKAAVKHGVPELVKALDDGKLAADVAAEASMLKPDAQKAFVAKVAGGANPRKAVDEMKPAGAPKKSRGKKGKQKDEPPPKPKAQKDGRGKAIPDSQKDAFGSPSLPSALTLISSWVDSLAYKNLLTDLQAAQHAYPYLDVAKVAGALAEAETRLMIARAAVENGTPFAVCLRCAGDGCDECRKGGHLPKWRFEELYGPVTPV